VVSRHQQVLDAAGRTKASKTITTTFFPVGDDFEAIAAAWVAFVRQECQWGLDDPLFPATRIAVGPRGTFEPAGLDRKCWSTAAPIRTIFRNAFENAGLPYVNAHSFRKTLARLGEQRCRTPEDFKAWSQNLGHEQVLTTFTSYGQVARDRQHDIMRSLATSPCSPTSPTLQDIMRQLATLAGSAPCG